MSDKKQNYVEITSEHIKVVQRAYFLLKKLNAELVKLPGARRANIPDAISEPIGCFCLNLLWNRGKEGDATNLKTGEIIDFKATTKLDHDLSSFSPSAKFDDLVYMEFDLETDLVYIYDLHMSSTDLLNVKVNKTETFKQQIEDKRRPRFSIAEKLHPQSPIVFDLKESPDQQDFFQFVLFR